MRSYFWQDVKDIILFFCLLIALVGFVVVGFFIVPIYFASRNECYAKLEAQKLDGNFGFWTDCMVRTKDGEMIPLDTYNIRWAIEHGIPVDELKNH